MVLIKRYPNRKLYNTETKEYINLEGIADLIRQGQEVKVLDHATGEDLTTLTLTQIILGEEKKQSGLLTHATLMGLIRTGEDRLSAFQHELLSSLNFWPKIDKKLEEYLEKRQVPTQKDLKRLNDQLDALAASVEEIAQSKKT